MDPPPQTLPPRFARPESAPLAQAAARARLLFGLLIAICLLFALYHAPALVDEVRPDSRFAPQRTVDLSSPVATPGGDPAAVRPSGPVLSVAIAPVISPERSVQTYDGFVHYLAAKLGRSPLMLQRSTYAQVNDLVQYRRCDVALVCTYAFVRGERSFGMQILAAPMVNGADTYHSLVLVPASSAATSLLDLRGKRFASADLLSSSGWVFPATWLIGRGEEPLHFFGEHLLTGSHDRSLEAVATGYADGAAMDSLVYDHFVKESPSLSGKVRLILKSPPFGTPPLVVHPGIDPRLREQILSVLLHIHEDPEGRRAISPIGIERFVVPEKDKYDSVRRMADVWEAR